MLFFWFQCFNAEGYKNSKKPYLKMKNQYTKSVRDILENLIVL